MKCYTVDGTGLDGLTIEERHDPEPGEREVLVDVHAVSLNYRDLLVAKGQYFGTAADRFIAGSDMAGTVARVGPGVTTFQPGDRVLNAPFRFWPAGTLRPEWARTFVGGAGVDGVLAERICYPATSLVKLPAHLSMDEGSTLTIAGLTAWAAVVTHGKTRPGEWVLVHGTGGVSIFAVQLAHMLGARTILTTSNPMKGKQVQEQFGVAEILDYRDEGWVKRVRTVTGGRGVDVVVEVAGGRSLRDSIRACTTGGRVALIGLLAGLESQMNVMDMIGRQVTVRGIFMESTEELQALALALEARQIHPSISRRFSFAEVKEAYAYLESQQHIGKVVITLRG